MCVSVLSSGTNASIALNATDLLVCGSAFCPAQFVSSEDNETDLEWSSSNRTEYNLEEMDNFRTEEEQIYLLAGIYLACSICAALIIAVFVDPISR